MSFKKDPLGSFIVFDYEKLVVKRKEIKRLTIRLWEERS